MSSTSKYNANGWSAYQPIRTKSNNNPRLLDEMQAAAWQSKHSPQHTKPQFKKRRDKHGHVKIIRVR